MRYLGALTEDELDREFEASYNPGTTAPVHRYILGNVNDCFQHVNQAAYVRGLLKGHGWMGK